MCDVEMQNWSISSLKLHSTSYSRVTNISVTLTYIVFRKFFPPTSTYSEHILLLLLLFFLLLLVFPEILPLTLFFELILYSEL